MTVAVGDKVQHIDHDYDGSVIAVRRDRYGSLLVTVCHSGKRRGVCRDYYASNLRNKKRHGVTRIIATP